MTTPPRRNTPLHAVGPILPDRAREAQPRVRDGCHAPDHRRAGYLRRAMEAAALGFLVKDIARRLFLSEGTVRNYLSSAISKTRTRNRMEALHVAEQNGWR